MQAINKIVSIVIFIIWSGLIFGNTSNDSVHYEVLMSTKMLNDIHLHPTFINSVNITSKRHILLSTNDQFYILGWGGITPFGNKSTGDISSFSFTPDSLLLIIRNKEVCYFDSLGNLSKLYNLPNLNMGIIAGKTNMYVYDRNTEKSNKALYLIAQGGNYAKLLEVTTPIQSVEEYNNTLLFSSGSALYQFDLKSKALKALASLPADKTIKSLTIDKPNNRIYFSTDSMICALKDTDKVLITDKFGGTLRYFNEGLIVFNAEKNFLIRLVDIENQITAGIKTRKNNSGTTSSEKVITNATIIDLVNKKVSDDLIINLINSSRVNFELCVDCMINLAGQNVSSPVIKAMKIAMRKQSTATK